MQVIDLINIFGGSTYSCVDGGVEKHRFFVVLQETSGVTSTGVFQHHHQYFTAEHFLF